MGFSEKKYHEYGMKISWKKHENPLNIQRFMAREKTLKNKKPMKMQWNKMKPTMFFSLLFNGNEKTMIWKAIFHGVRIYGVFVAVSKFMPNKKKKHEFSVNSWILMFMKNEMETRAASHMINRKKNLYEQVAHNLRGSFKRMRIPKLQRKSYALTHLTITLERLRFNFNLSLVQILFPFVLRYGNVW